MAFLGPLMSREGACDFVTGQIVNQSLFGHCFWPIERRIDRQLLGYCGLNPGPVETPLEGRIEIGWQLAYNAWHQGYAREAAGAVLGWAWTHTDCGEIFAMTTPGNTRSRGLMERLGITRVPDGYFDHPGLAEGDPLRRHLTYAIDRPRPTASAPSR